MCDACASECYAAVFYGLVECVSQLCVVFSLELKGLTINPIEKKDSLEFAVAPSESINGWRKKIVRN